ncbi:uncharacterized protein LOC121872535 [Homarus americanus]|uniref:uncharacterized protein LOC121872535 n=1 Tax=Homarus americanus TaxID=6706 RepID=UPI001C472322|nr:uncharacterized protein LOC121872535 [Homarus americanus]
MTVAEPNRTSPLLQLECEEQLTTVAVTQKKLKRIIRKVNVRKAVGLDNISLYVLRHCANELIFEKLVTEEVSRHFDHHNLLSNRQSGFTSDLLLLLSRDWQDALDNDLDTLVISLETAGDFDRVWHRGFLEKLRAKGIEGNHLLLLAD